MYSSLASTVATPPIDSRGTAPLVTVSKVVQEARASFPLICNPSPSGLSAVVV